MENKQFFIKRYKQLFNDFEDKDWSLRRALRVNTLKISENELIKRLKAENIKLEKIPFLKNGYYYEAKFSLGSTPEYLQGYYYLQETSSQIPPEVLDPKENELVIDMCAAPGSKTTQLAQLMNNKGTIVALDNVKWRLTALRNNIERLSISNILIYNKDARYATDFKQKFDKILLDAPCAGNYVTDRSWFDKRNLIDIKERAKTQKEMLKTASKILADNGTLLYSTCSLEPEENELVVNWALENLKLELEEIKLDFGRKGLTKVFDEELNPEIEKTFRCLPQDGLEPFYIAKFKKKSE